MKTNVAIELEPEQLFELACTIEGKPVKRRATRKEIADICQRHIAALVQSIKPLPLDKHPARSGLYEPSPDDPLAKTMARPNDPGYCYGWNKVRLGMKS